MDKMNIALVAGNTKKELMIDFCIAYSGVLSKHNLVATGTTGELVSEATGLNVQKFLAGVQGGDQQLGARIAYNEIDLLFLFRDASAGDDEEEENIINIMRLCDSNNVPMATNVATAEVLVHGLERGDLDWRNIVNPK